MTITINGTAGITTPEVILDNTSADGGQVVLKSSGYSNWNLDNYSGRFRAYYNSTEYFTVTNSGNVGIGTSSPSTKLHVVDTTGGMANFISTAYGGGNIQLSCTNASSTVTGYVGANAFTYNVFGVGTSTSTPLTFVTNGSERARIDSSGNLLVGITSASSYRLYVAADSAGSSYPAGFNNTNTGTNSQVVVDILRNSTRTGYITNTNNTTSFTSTSDYRLKEDVQPMQNALAKVATLNPVTYKWKSDGSDGQGFIAHELQEIFPDAVHGEKDAVDSDGNPVYQGIDTSFLVATLTAAIQEQQAIIESLKTRIEALENK